jgi:hypothetical protein
MRVRQFSFVLVGERLLVNFIEIYIPQHDERVLLMMEGILCLILLDGAGRLMTLMLRPFVVATRFP